MKQGDFSKKWIRRIIIFLTIFTGSILVLFWHTGNEPAVLIGSVFGFFTTELWNMAMIKKEKIKKEREDE